MAAAKKAKKGEVNGAAKYDEVSGDTIKTKKSVCPRCGNGVFLAEHGDWKNLTVILETPGKHSPGAQALCSMWDSYGCIRGILESRGIRHHRIAPQQWQKKMLVGCAKGDTKPAALAKARQLWPQETWLASSRCSKPHDGMIDAALIAEYGRISNL